MEKNKEKIAESSKVSCADVQCPVHGKLKVRGREFRGYVIKKFPRRAVVEFGRIVPVSKYERYYMKKSRIHARVPACIENDVKIGDYVLVRECRPLSKIIHFVIIKRLKERK